MIVAHVGGRTLVDREALAQWAERSANTVRLRCPVLCYVDGVAFYDAHACLALLDAIPTRRRAA